MDTRQDPALALIMDYHLDPHSDDGLAVAQRINDGRQVPLPVIMVTADREQPLKQRCAWRGHTLLYKPLKPMKLKLALQQALGQGGVSAPDAPASSR